MISKVLIANRGEIAVRIIRACREMGIQSVAVFSEADHDALHVRLADEAYCIGPPPPLESYLNMDRIVEVARECGAEAIHPGYGFLAENHLFARRCEEEGIVFIGPPSRALELVGDKLASRRVMAKAGVPVIPGMSEKAAEEGTILARAKEVGYPVIIKASLGGGGKGMRVARNEEELRRSLESCRREARSAFGDETVYIEKYLERPHHVEFQILADKHGNVIHLFERECSIQRRHQKIVEETPSPALMPELRQKMGEAAIRAARAAGYENAGTVEFLLDSEGNFYFLEVNARLQVEHPITELVTGVDLVRQQIKLAAGEQLEIKQEELVQRGHAIECRIYAEDPSNNFLPCSGKIEWVEEPRGPGIRCDSGIYSGLEVPVYYDPILSKVIVWAENREAARLRMVEALRSYVILGIETTVGFLARVMCSEDFVKGNTTTDFIERNMDKLLVEDSEAEEIALVAAALFSAGKSPSRKGIRTEERVRFDPWLALGDFELWRK